MSTTKIDFLENFPIKVGLSNIEGRGIFSTREIKEGETIERCPMVPLAFRSRYHSDPQIYKYLYSQPTCPCNECKNHGFKFYMVLGYGMIYNHQDNANTEWQFDFPNHLADIIAIKDIKSGDEIFVDYGTKYFNNKEKIENTDNAKNN